MLFSINDKVEWIVPITHKNTLCWQMHQKWGDKVLRVCPNRLWLTSFFASKGPGQWCQQIIQIESSWLAHCWPRLAQYQPPWLAGLTRYQPPWLASIDPLYKPLWLAWIETISASMAGFDWASSASIAGLDWVNISPRVAWCSCCCFSWWWLFQSNWNKLQRLVKFGHHDLLLFCFSSSNFLQQNKNNFLSSKVHQKALQKLPTKNDDSNCSTKTLTRHPFISSVYDFISFVVVVVIVTLSLTFESFTFSPFIFFLWSVS